ncbi:MAG: hypothetical protein ACK5M3_04365 [Dysgonomonas sp.]
MIVIAETELCVINDPDGFVNVRSGAGAGFTVVGKLEEADFFYADLEESQGWIKVTAMKWADGAEVVGYVDKSRVQSVRTLDMKQQGTLLKDVLSGQLRRSKAFNEGKLSRQESERYGEYRYSPALEILPLYFCRTKDVSVLQLFYSVLWADEGSADERPTFVIGECYICDSIFVIQQLELLSNIEQQNTIFTHIEWGLLNSENKDIDIFKIRLNKDKDRVLKLTP